MVCERCIKLSKQAQSRPPLGLGLGPPAAGKIGVHKYILTIFLVILSVFAYHLLLRSPVPCPLDFVQPPAIRLQTADQRKADQVKASVASLSPITKPSEAISQVGQDKASGGQLDNEVIWIGGGQRGQRQPPSTPHPPSPNARSS